MVTGPFEKMTKITMILPLTGPQYSEKVMENCVTYLKGREIYTEEEVKAVEKFMDIFKNETFPPTSSILFTLSPLGTLTVCVHMFFFICFLGFTTPWSIPIT